MIAQLVEVNDESDFDLIQVSQGKAQVRLSPYVLRQYHKQGLRFYRRGKFAFVSKKELREFLCSTSNSQTKGGAV
jgi:hypothetical protein